MRFTEEAPAGTMEFLFISVILKLKDRGFDGFSLGTAPLVGLDRARHKRLWDHLGGAVSTFGGRFYNFEGLRDYKNKFQPQWEPRYMATWGGMDPLLVAADVNALVSGVSGCVYSHDPQALTTILYNHPQRCLIDTGIPRHCGSTGTRAPRGWTYQNSNT